MPGVLDASSSAATVDGFMDVYDAAEELVVMSRMMKEQLLDGKAACDEQQSVPKAPSNIEVSCRNQRASRRRQHDTGLL